MDAAADQPDMTPDAHGHNGQVPRIEGLDGDAILEMINGIESRLETLRESHMRQAEDVIADELEAEPDPLPDDGPLIGRAEGDDPDAETQPTDGDPIDLNAAFEARIDSLRDGVDDDGEPRPDDESSEIQVAPETELADAQALSPVDIEISDREEMLRVQFEQVEADRVELQRERDELNARRDEQDPTPDHSEEIERLRAELESREQRRAEETGQIETIRVELTQLRQRLASAEGDLPAAREQKAKREQQRRVQRRKLFQGAIWLATAIITGVAIIISITAHDPTAAATVFGVAFAGYFFGTRLLAGRLLDAGSIPIGLIAASFGLWFPMWLTMVEDTIATLNVPLEFFPAAVVPQLPLGIAILTAGTSLCVALVSLTGSFRLLGFGLVATLAATALSLLSFGSSINLIAGAVLWQAVMAAALSRWAATVETSPA